MKYLQKEEGTNQFKHVCSFVFSHTISQKNRDQEKKKSSIEQPSSGQNLVITFVLSTQTLNCERIWELHVMDAVFTVGFIKRCSGHQSQNSTSAKKQTKTRQEHVLPQTRAWYTIQGSLTHKDREENSKTVSQ